MSNLTQDTNPGIPLGVAQVTLILLRRAIDERNRMIKLGARTPGLSLWLTPDGQLVYKRLRKRSSNVSRKKRKSLLICEFCGACPSRPALISRLICWVVDGQCSVLPDLLSESDLAEAYCQGFFHAIEDAAACEKGKQAVMSITKKKLLEKAARPSEVRS